MSVPEVVVDRPKRWDEPFGTEPLAEADIAHVLSVAPFSGLDASAFGQATPLRELLKNDTRLVECRDGDVVFRQGDYQTSAFFVISGKVRVVLSGLSSDDFDEEIQGAVKYQRRGFWSALKQLWSNTEHVESRNYTHTAGNRVLEGGLFVEDVPGVLDKYGTATLERGSLFGEISALARTPRTASVFAEGDTTLLEVRWQGLRDILRRASELRGQVEHVYRENALKSVLRAHPVFANVDDRQQQAVADATTFSSHGDRAWTHRNDDDPTGDPRKILRDEPVIAQEGNYPNGILVIRSGFARVSQRFGNGQRTVRYLGAGAQFGLAELVHNSAHPESLTPYRLSLSAVGYVDILQVPTRCMEEIVLPSLSPETLQQLCGNDLPSEVRPEADYRRTDVLEELVDTRFINGTQTMMIDLTRCTHCDDCVRACEATHDGNPRFIRHGKKVDRFMVANACMHCQDPVCMIGCPTGAIHRWALEGQVVINDRTCIGCARCADNCPYDNIRMVGIRDTQGQPMVDTEGAPIIKATKCDLCIDQNAAVGPACQNACPHAALKRVDMSEPNFLQELLER